MRVKKERYNSLKILEGKELVYRQDPVFPRRSGWCILTGSIITEMQSMCWVHDLLKDEEGRPGDRLTIQGGKIIKRD